MSARLRALAALLALSLPLGGCIDALSTRPVTASIDSSAVTVPPGGSEDFVVNVGRRTFFREGSSELDGVAKETLDKQVAWLQRYPVWTVKIQGFADDPGSPRDNVALSARRAQAVRTYLAAQGIGESRMTMKGYGRERLVRDCSDLSCQSQNRRVVTNLVGDRDL